MNPAWVSQGVRGVDAEPDSPHQSRVEPLRRSPDASAELPLRILMVSESYPPIAGGAEQYVRNLSVALQRRGHDVSVATLASVSTRQWTSTMEYGFTGCG